MTIGNFPKPLHITLLLVTLTGVSAAANRILGSNPEPPALTTISLEAEQGLLMPPMIINSTASASGGAYLSSNARDAGLVTFSVDLATDGNYVIWGRVLAPDYYQDSFYVSIDGGPEDVYDVAHDLWSDSWQWTRVNGRLEGGTPLTANPRVFELSAGTHEIVFRAREPDTKLDRLIITNDINFIPDEPPPPPTPIPTPVGKRFYVSPQGRPSGNGGQDNPWDFATAMSHPDSVKPGDTLYLRGGTYRLDWTAEPDTAYGSLTGAASAPITVRSYPGERAIIDVDYLLQIHGSYTHYVDLEFTCSRPNKVVSTGWSPHRPGAVGVSGTGVKIINSVLHDLSSFNAYKEAVDFELYGNLMYYFGLIGNLDRPGGNTGYIQNEAGTKVIADNLMFHQFMHNLQVYGSDAANLKDIHVEGNTLINPGILSGIAGFNVVMWVGERPAERLSFVNNYAYTSVPDAGSNAVFWGAGGVVNKDLKITGNYFIGGSPVMRTGVWDPATVTNNTLSGANGLLWYEGSLPQGRRYNWDNNSFHYQGAQYPPFVYAGNGHDFAGWKQAAAGMDGNSAYAPGKPTGVSVSVRPNRYQVGRAHITVYNPGLLNTVSVDISSVGLALGQRYEVRDAQNYYGAPIYSGTYDGNPVALPTNLTAVTPIVGANHAPNFVPHPPNHTGMKLPAHTSKELNAFVLLPR